MLVLEPAGSGLLLKGVPGETALTVATAVLGVAALAADVQNWVRQPLLPAERLPLIGAGLLLGYPQPWSDAAGLILVGVVHWLRTHGRRTV
ncbi:MAG: hypothetical protein ACREU7_02770 [Burkholderiales bacterium]